MKNKTIDNKPAAPVSKKAARGSSSPKLMDKVEKLLENAPKPEALEPAPLATATYAELCSEVQRRRNAMRKTRGAGTGRPRVIKTCETCGGQFSAREFRQHKCPKQGATNDQM